MYGPPGFTGSADTANPTREEHAMKGHLKNALMTTGIVLLTIYIARKAPVVGPIVNKAITG